MPFQKQTNQGFSLIELIVSIAIIAVLYSTVTVGIRGFGNRLNLQETEYFLTSFLSQQQLKMIANSIDRSVVYFLPDYLMVEEYESDLLLLTSAGTCTNGSQIQLTDAKGGPPPAGSVLLRRDSSGNTYEETMTNNAFCVTNFDQSLDNEWSFQGSVGSEVSNRLRFVHFNADRQSKAARSQILNASGEYAELIRELNARHLYDAMGIGVSSLSFTVNLADPAARTGSDLAISIQ